MGMEQLGFKERARVRTGPPLMMPTPVALNHRLEERAEASCLGVIRTGSLAPSCYAVGARCLVEAALGARASANHATTGGLASRSRGPQPCLVAAELAHPPAAVR